MLTGQTDSGSRTPGETKASTNVASLNQAPDAEFERRWNASKEAITAGDPARIRAAERSLLAIALREMGELRMVEGAYETSVLLYNQSLAFEDLQLVHRRTAVAYAQLNEPDESLAEVNKVIAADPHDGEAWLLRGNALALKHDYSAAAAAYERSLKIKGDGHTAYYLAVCFLKQRDLNKAKLVFEDMVANFGDTAAVHSLIGRAYVDSGYLPEALSEFRRAAAIDPNTPRIHHYIAMALLEQSEWRASGPEVYDELRADLKQNPRDFAANYILGATAFQDKNFEIAEPALKVAAEVSPELPEPWLYLGLIRLDQERYSEAELALRKAIETTGANEDRNNYQIRRAHLALARILAKRGDTDQAQKEFQKTRELSGKGLEQSQQTVSTLMAEGGGSTDFGPVIAQLKKEKKPGLEGLNPTAPISDKNSSLQQQEEAKAEDAFLREILATSFNDLGTAEAQSGQFRLALEHFQQAEKWNANVPNLSRNIGLAAMKTQDYTQAASALSEHLIAHPDDNSARAALGISLYALGRFAEAAQTIAPLDELALQDPQLGYAWAVSLSKLGQLKESAQILARLDTTRMPPEMLLLVGQTWGDDQHYETAIELFHRALQLDPRLRQAHYDAGLAYLRSDQPQLAAKEFEAELALSPHDLDAKYNLAFTLLQQSKQASATKLLEEVTRANPKQAEAQYQLGKLLLGEGKIGAAIAHLEVAAQFAPDKDYIHYQLQNAYRKASRQQDAERELGLYKELRERAKQTTARPKQP